MCRIEVAWAGIAEKDKGPEEACSSQESAIEEISNGILEGVSHYQEVGRVNVHDYS